MKRKVIQRLFEFPDYIINEIDNTISINSFINQAILNNIHSDISLIKISKKTHTVPIRVRINFETYENLKNLTNNYNISMQKLIIHFVLSEIKK